MKKHHVGLLSLLLCLCCLTGCGGKHKWTSGEVVERFRDGDGKLAAFVVETNSGKQVGFRLTEETLIWPYLDDFPEEDFLYEEPAGVVVTVWPESRTEKLVMTSGEKVPTYAADSVSIEELLNPNALTLSDGTSVGVWKGRWDTDRYVLEDGTELLRERRPFGPENVSVGGVENFEAFSETAQKAVLAYYAEQGERYDLPAELERAYAAYLESREDGMTFNSWHVEQEIVPTASNDRVMYYETSVSLPVDNAGTYTEWEYCAAFDRRTGERIDTRDLFTCGEVEAKNAILKAAGAEEYYPELAEAMAAAFDWERLVFTEDGLWFTYPVGTLSGVEDGAYALSAEYNQLADILHGWAVPEPYKAPET